MVRKIPLCSVMLRIGAAERKAAPTALENRDVVCATATGKIAGQQGNKLNPKNACISCCRTGDRSAGRERAFRNIWQLDHTITVPYHTILYCTIPYTTVLCLKNVRIWSVSTEKLGDAKSPSVFVCLTLVQDKTKPKALLRVLAAEMQTLTMVPVCRGDGLTNCCTVNTRA